MPSWRIKGGVFQNVFFSAVRDRHSLPYRNIPPSHSPRYRRIRGKYFAFHAVDVARPFVIAGLNACERIAAVHDVRLAVNYRATIKPGGEQIARVNVAGRSNFGGRERGRIFVRRKLRCFRHRRGDGVGQRQFLVVSAAQQPADHFETFVVKFQFLFQIGTVHEQMQMVVVDQRRIFRIAPPFGVEMQTKHEIGMQPCVYQNGATTNLAVAIE